MATKREVEKLLTKYKLMQTSLENLKMMYKDVTERDIGNNVSREHVGKTFNFYSDTENKGLDLVEINERIKSVDRRIKIIQKSFRMLSPIEQQVIELRYFDNMTWLDIECKMHYSTTWLKKNKNDALDKLCFMIDGDNFI